MRFAAKLSRVSSAGALSALLCLASGAHAQAADDASTAAEESGEIIVTAQRRAERLQDVPIAISVIGADDLTAAGANDIGALRASVPGLTISNAAGINASNLVSIRGVGGLAVPIGTSQATALYLDGVYLSRPDAAFFSLDDVERVEVLRGPQGALYGRNATAGAINIITRTPGDELRAGFDVSTGNFAAVSARASVSGPLGGGFGAGISASYDRRDGYYINNVNGARVDGLTGYTLRGKFSYRSPDGDFSAVLAGDYSHRKDAMYLRNLYSSVAPPSVIVGVGNPDRVNADLLTDNLVGNDIEGKGVSLTLDYRAGEIDFTSITAYREIASYLAYDVDGTALPAVISAIDNRGKTFNQEIRGVLSSGPINLTFGGNYFHEEASVGFTSQSPATPLALTNPFTTTTVNAYAAFGQLEYDLTDTLTLVGGLRFNYEKRDFVVDYSRALPTPGGLGAGSVDDSVFIPSVGINFKAAPDILIYAKVSRGYQAPGYNGFVGLASASLVNTFAAEHLTAYEAGFKSQFLDRKLTLNVAGFYYDYTDLQVRAVFSTSRIVVNNAASARIKGVEANLIAAPTDFLTLTAQGQYLDASYEAFCEPITAGSPQASDPLCAAAGTADRAGNRLTQAPEWSGSLAADLHVPVAGAGTLNARATYTWESNVYFTAPNEPLVSSGGWDRVDLRLGFEIDGGPEFYVYGRNIADRRYVSYSGRGSPLLAQAGLNDPRTYGFGMRYRF